MKWDNILVIIMGFTNVSQKNLSTVAHGFYINTSYIYHKKKFNTLTSILIMGMIMGMIMGLFPFKFLKWGKILVNIMEFTNA